MPDKIEKMVDGYLDSLGITKADPGMIMAGNHDFGGVLPRETIAYMQTLMDKPDSFYDAIQKQTVDSPKGFVMLMKMAGVMSEKVTEGDNKMVTNTGLTWNVPYSCSMLKANVVILKSQVEAFRTAGKGDFESHLNPLIGRGLRRDAELAVIQANKTLDNSTRKNRMLNAFDGLFVKAESGQVINKEGKGFGDGVFDVMIDAVDEDYYDVDNMKFIFNSKMEHVWKMMLAIDRKTGIGDMVSTTGGKGLSPSGIPHIISNNIPRTMGPTGTPDTAAGTTNVSVQVDTLLGGAATQAGRKVKITCKATQVSYVATVTHDGSNNFAATPTGNILGQDTVSTTASDYEVKIHDETAAFLMDPMGLALVMTSNDWEAYREFDIQLRGWILTFYFNMDILVPLPDAIVMLKRLCLPQIEDWNAWVYPPA